MYLPWRREWLEWLERLDRLNDADLLRLEREERLGCEERLECEERLVDAFVLVLLALILLPDADNTLRYTRHMNIATSTRPLLIVTTPVTLIAVLLSKTAVRQFGGCADWLAGTQYPQSLRYGGGVYGGAENGAQPCLARMCSRPQSAAWRSTHA